MSDRDSIRKRPDMYIGDTRDGSGLHNMVQEVAQNALNEALAGYGQRIDVILNTDGSCTVRDNGRGIPVELHPTEHISAAEYILTRLVPGRFYAADNDSERLHGVGVAVVNALSQWLELRVWRNGETYIIRFRDGEPEAPLTNMGNANGRRGTEIIFLPSDEIFADTGFNFAVLEQHFRQLARPGGTITLTLVDRRSSPEKEVALTL